MGWIVLLVILLYAVTSILLVRAAMLAIEARGLDQEAMEWEEMDWEIEMMDAMSLDEDEEDETWTG